MAVISAHRFSIWQKGNGKNIETCQFDISYLKAWYVHYLFDTSHMKNQYPTFSMDDVRDTDLTQRHNAGLLFHNHIPPQVTFRICCSQLMFTIESFAVITTSSYIDGILPKRPYPPCLRMADRALLAGYPRYMGFIGRNSVENIGQFIHGCNLSCRRYSGTHGYRSEMLKKRIQFAFCNFSQTKRLINCIGYSDIRFQLYHGSTSHDESNCLCSLPDNLLSLRVRSTRYHKSLVAEL